MQGLALFIAAVILCRAVGIALRRFIVGSVIIQLLGRLSVFLFILGIAGDIMEISVLAHFRYFIALMFLTTPVCVFFQSLCQLVGDMYVKLSGKGQRRFAQRGTYILPFTEKWTVYNGGVDEKLQHGGSVSQTYAYDFIILDDGGKSFQGNIQAVDSYFCYGKDIIAPADGTVVKVRKKAKDTFVNGYGAWCDSPDIRGNYVVIKHHDNEYSLSAHLMPGSIVVNTGDIVKQGQLIAKCGNSGNTSEPHLHFQLQSGKSFFFSAGLPIAFSGIEAQEKINYNLADTRSCDNNLQTTEDKIYIGRGLEVYNTISRCFSAES